MYELSAVRQEQSQHELFGEQNLDVQSGLCDSMLNANIQEFF